MTSIGFVWNPRQFRSRRLVARFVSWPRSMTCLRLKGFIEVSGQTNAASRPRVWDSAFYGQHLESALGSREERRG